MNTQALNTRNFCENCALVDSCISNVDKKSVIGTQSRRIYHKADSLFSAGHTFDALYVLRSGSAKSSITSRVGDEQITNFYYPGDLLGIDGFDTGKYTHTLCFLETSSVCRIGLGQLDSALANSYHVRQKLLRSMSHALINEEQLLLSISKMTSEQRLANFLLDLSNGFKLRGLSGKVFDLSMTRVDIANYLGMAIETISRLLTRMQDQGIIVVQRRQIQLLNETRLRFTLYDEDDPQITFVPKSINCTNLATNSL
jgi:CRP/FNR family transcriptional regulator